MKPILFSTNMIQAIMSGRKTQTRRLVKTRSWICDVEDGIPYEQTEDDPYPITCPYGQPGDLLWVTEPFKYVEDARVARIWLQIKSVRAEYLIDISEEDAIAEGVEPVEFPGIPAYRNYLDEHGCFSKATNSFCSLWESIYGPGSWPKNRYESPIVWVIEFEKINAPYNP